MIVGTAGRIGSGKTTIARYLVEQYGFQRLSYSVMLTDLLRANKAKVKPTRQDLQRLGCLLTDAIGHAGLTVILLREAKGEDVCIDGIRHYDSYKFLVHSYGHQFRLIYRDVPVNIRYLLHNRRSQPPDAISFADFETIDNHPGETGIDRLEAHADLKLSYFEDIAQLYKTVDTFIRLWRK
jgi:hypothetical protein